MMTSRIRAVSATFSTVFVLAALQPAAQGQRPAVPQRADDKTIVHVLNRLGFGPTPATIERVRRIGLSAYIEQQLHPDRIADTAVAARLAPFTTLDKSSRELADEYLPARPRWSAGSSSAAPRQNGARRPAGAGRITPARTPEQMDAMRMQRAPIAELSQQKILRAAYSDRQLEEVMVDFWFNHFNVFVGKGQVRTYLTEYERDAIRPHVLGKFRDLLGATAEEPGDALLSRQLAEHAAIRSAPRRRTMATARERRPAPAQQMQRRGRPGASPDHGRPAAHDRRHAASGSAARAQRELRARADGAAHARRRRRLHAEGRAGSRARLHRLDDRRPAPGRPVPVRAAPSRRRREGRARASGSRPAAASGRRTGARPPGEASVDGAFISRPSSRGGSSPTSRRPTLVDARGRALPGDRRRHSRSGADDRDVAGVLRRRGLPREGQEPVRVRRQRGARDGAMSATRCRWCRRIRDLGMPLYGAQPPTGYSDKAEAWVNTGALAEPDELRARAVGRTAARDAARTRVRTDGGGQVDRVGRAGWVGVTTSGARSWRRRSRTTSPNPPARRRRKRPRRRRPLRLILGSPEFQKR